MRAHPDRFDVRRRDGRAVDGHGDLHLAHVWFERDESYPVLIDCIEFTDRLRRIDAASEVAFLAMDLRYRGRDRLAERFLRRYAAETDDFHLYAVVDYFVSYRAAVRAKVAAMAAGEPELPQDQRRAARESASRHLDLAIEVLRTRQSGAVVVLTGVVGTGKSTAADVISETLCDAVVVSSDRIRKRMAGLAAAERAPATVEGGIYTEDDTRRVYAGLLERAQSIVIAGRVAVLDATFSRHAQRAAATEFARLHGVPVLLVETQCAEASVLRRLDARERVGDDPSDAGPAFFAEHVARYEPVESGEYGAHVTIDTARPSWRRDLEIQARAWQASW